MSYTERASYNDKMSLRNRLRSSNSQSSRSKQHTSPKTSENKPKINTKMNDSCSSVEIQNETNDNMGANLSVDKEYKENFKFVVEEMRIDSSVSVKDNNSEGSDS